MLKFYLVFIICSISLSEGCKCARPEGWEQKAYCTSKFAGIIKVLSNVNNCGTKHCYSINVVNKLHGPSISPNVLTTASDSAACGVSLTKGHTYFVVTASPNTDLLTISLNSCQLYRDWTELTPSELKQKIQKYQQIPCDK